MNPPFPPPPDDFSPEEVEEWNDMCARCPEGGKPNPDYVRAGRRFFTRTLIHPAVLGGKVFPLDRHDPLNKP